MELRQLRHFVALAEALNFHRAAEALHLSQPPLSVSIRKLEVELGAPLFERHPRGVVLTEAGRGALPYARDALNAADALAQVVRETATGARGRVRVGFVGTATYALIPAIVPLFRQRHPAIELSLKEFTSVEIVRALEAGDLDVGLIRTPALEVGGVALEPLYNEPLLLMVPRDHPLPDGVAVRLRDLRDEPFVFYDRNQVPNLWNYGLMACEAAGFLPRIAEEAANIHTVVALVESGLGVAFAPAIMQRVASGRVRCVPLTGETPLQIGFALATRPAERSLVVKVFAELARDVARQFDTR